MDSFSNKLVLITGGSSGIGLALAKKFANTGANIAILARRPDVLEKACVEIESVRSNQNQKVDALTADVSDWNQISSVLSAFVNEHGTPDILINCAGITRPGLFEELPMETFPDMVNVDYLGTVYPIRAVIQGMLQRQTGYIVNISSVAGYLGTFGYTAYGAAKYAVRGFSDVLRAEMKPRGIKVSLVFPPDTQTPQFEFEQQFKPEVTKILGGTVGVLSPETVADTIMRGMKRNQYIITPGFNATFYYHLSNLLGNLVYPVMDSMVADAIRKGRSTHG